MRMCSSDSLRCSTLAAVLVWGAMVAALLPEVVEPVPAPTAAVNFSNNISTRSSISCSHINSNSSQHLYHKSNSRSACGSTITNMQHGLIMVSPAAQLLFWRCLMLWTAAVVQAAKSVVHCSAGVGRTGTFIAIDILLHRLHNLTLQLHGSVTDDDIRAAMDIPGFVASLRKQRRGTVQTGEQYAFIWQAVMDELELLVQERQQLQQEQLQLQQEQHLQLGPVGDVEQRT